MLRPMGDVDDWEQLLKVRYPAEGSAPPFRTVDAEKPPEALFDRVKQIAPLAEVIEGYGITECSPAIALTVPGATAARVARSRSASGLSVGDTGLLACADACDRHRSYRRRAPFRAASVRAQVTERFQVVRRRRRRSGG